MRPFPPASGSDQLLTFTEKVSVAVPLGNTLLDALPQATAFPDVV